MTSNCNIQKFFVSLKKDPINRTPQDILDISYVIHTYFESLDLETTRYLSNFAHYISYEKDGILFNINDPADSWFILLSGAVFLKGKTYWAPCSFGKIYDGHAKRDYQCKSIEHSELMKIFYPSAVQINSFKSMSNFNCVPGQSRISEYNAKNINNNNNNNLNNKNYSSDDEEVEDDNLGESFHEFDFSDLANDSFTSITVKDVVLECLERLPDERTAQDVITLREFLLHFNNQVFNGLQKEMQETVSKNLSYSVVEKEGTVVISEGEELTHWAFVINGCLEIVHPCNESYNKLIHMGDSFGIDPCRDGGPSKSQFTIVTRVPSCHYISVAKEDWDLMRLKEGLSVEKETIEDGRKVLVVEEREVKKGRKGCFVKKGTSEQLIKFLVDERSAEDPTYVEDFLLTSRIFFREGMANLTCHLMLWFNAGGRLRDKSVRIVLLWVNNHFEDFEDDFSLSDFLTRFMECMRANDMTGQLELLRRACYAQAKSRKVVVERSSQTQPWSFGILVGKEPRKVFIDTTVLLSSKNTDQTSLLIKGDQILELNGNDCTGLGNKSVLELINKSTRLELELKCNFVEHSEVLTSQKSRNIFPKQSCSQEESEKSKKKSEWTTKRLFSNVIEPFIRKINIFGQSPLTPPPLVSAHARRLVTGSNPDLSTIHSSRSHTSPQGDNNNISGSQDALSIYLPNQSKPISLAVTKCQNVSRVVKMALKSLGFFGDASSHSLFEVTFKEDRVMKYSRLPDCTVDLRPRINEDTRFYLVSNSAAETNWTNDLRASGDLDGSQAGNVSSSLWHLKTQEVAVELCSRDFQLFRNIQASEYVDFVFNKVEGGKTKNLSTFSKLVNEEMFWVVTEICSETGLDNRVKLIQFFLKTAQHCLEANNFNSMFAILSGLRHNSVSKLKQTWKRLPTKYMKLFENLEDLLDPSNNMSKYRSLLNVRLAQSPAIPFFPIVMKDLTFIDLGNKTQMDGMVNYEKMRMIAKQVSRVTNMASPFYHSKSLEVHSSLNAEAAITPPITNITAFATIRKRKTPLAISQLKSEENTGLVKKYFENLKVIQNEEELEKMSLSLESQRYSSSRSKSEHSPQSQPKSNTEQKLSTSFKFGADSAQSIQKLMGLTEKISLHQHGHDQSSAGTHQWNNNNSKKRPNALSLSSYDTLVLATTRRGHNEEKRKSHESSGRRRDAVALTPTTSKALRLFPTVKLTSESSSVAAAPVRSNPTINIGRALFAITNQRPFNMTLGVMADKSSVSSSVEELENIFSGPYLKSQSTPVSPCRSIPTGCNPSLQNGSPPKNASPKVLSVVGGGGGSVSSGKLNRSVDCYIDCSPPPPSNSDGIAVPKGDHDQGKQSFRCSQEGASPPPPSSSSFSSAKNKRKSLTRQRKEVSLDAATNPLREFSSPV